MLMLVTLRHLLVAIGLLVVGVVLLPTVHAVAEESGMIPTLTLAGAIIVVIAPTMLLSWPLYKMLRLRPLILPLCPHCKKRHGNYHIPADAWPDPVLLCVHCGQPLQLLLTRRTHQLRRQIYSLSTCDGPNSLAFVRRL